MSLGRMCMEDGWSFHWEPFGKPVFVDPSGRSHELEVEHYVPVLPVGSVSEPADTGTGETLASDNGKDEATKPPPDGQLPPMHM